jgi:hypothetical protein
MQSHSVIYTGMPSGGRGRRFESSFPDQISAIFSKQAQGAEVQLNL